jgi:hypothetical protein
MSDKELPFDWLRHAANDLIAARHLFDTLCPKQTEIAAYHSHKRKADSPGNIRPPFSKGGFFIGFYQIPLVFCIFSRSFETGSIDKKNNV